MIHFFTEDQPLFPLAEDASSSVPDVEASFDEQSEVVSVQHDESVCQCDCGVTLGLGPYLIFQREVLFLEFCQSVAATRTQAPTTPPQVVDHYLDYGYSPGFRLSTSCEIPCQLWHLGAEWTHIAPDASGGVNRAYGRIYAC